MTWWQTVKTQSTFVCCASCCTEAVLHHCELCSTAVFPDSSSTKTSHFSQYEWQTSCTLTLQLVWDILVPHLIIYVNIFSHHITKSLILSDVLSQYFISSIFIYFTLDFTITQREKLYFTLATFKYIKENIINK